MIKLNILAMKSHGKSIARREYSENSSAMAVVLKETKAWCKLHQAQMDSKVQPEALSRFEGYHCEVGGFIDIDEVTIYKGDEKMDGLFDYDAFFEQFQEREVRFMSGAVVSSGDTVIADCGYNRFEEVRFMYKDTLSGQYICERDNVLRPTKAYKRIYPDTETNRRNANLNIR